MLTVLRDRNQHRVSVQADWTLSQSFADVPADQRNILDPETLPGVLDATTVAWDIAGEKPWCESAVVAHMVSGIKLLLRKIPPACRKL